jgi:hypothetical protein
VDAGIWVGLGIIAAVLLWFRHLAKDRTPPARYRLRQQGKWRLGWRIGPFWFL